MLSVKEKLHLIYVWEEEENAEDSPFYGVYGSARKEESKQQSRWYLIARVKKSNPRYNTIIEHLSRKYSHIKAVEVDSVLPEGFIDEMFP